MSKERFQDDPVTTIYKTARVEDLDTLSLFVERIPNDEERDNARKALSNGDTTTVHEILAETKVLIISV